jgi:hypothetical protein
MVSKSPWKVEAVLYDPKAEEQLDWIEIAPGPTMRGWLGDKFSPCIGGVMARAVTFLMVTRLSSGATKQARIIKDRRKYRARYNGELLTLEAAVKMMKEELRLGR